MTSLPPQLEALLLLDAYNKRQSVAQSEQKDCLWNIQKARRQKMRGSVTNASEISALGVREEFYPRAVLKEGDETQNKTTTTDNLDPQQQQHYYWTLVDPLLNNQDKKEEEATATTSSSQKENHAQGIRQRKGVVTKEKDKKAPADNNGDNNKWTTELLDDEVLNEEDMLRKANPITLFGALPSHDLRQAQKNATASLGAYIDAANFAVAILKLTETKKDSTTRK